MASPILTTRLCSAGVVIWVCLTFLPAATTRLRGGPPGRWPGCWGPRPKRSPLVVPRAISPARPRRRSSSSRSLISMRRARRGGVRPGSWMNAPVAAEPVITGWAMVLRTGRVSVPSGGVGRSRGGRSAAWPGPGVGSVGTGGGAAATGGGGAGGGGAAGRAVTSGAGGGGGAARGPAGGGAAGRAVTCGRRRRRGRHGRLGRLDHLGAAGDRGPGPPRPGPGARGGRRRERVRGRARRPPVESARRRGAGAAALAGGRRRGGSSGRGGGRGGARAPADHRVRQALLDQGLVSFPIQRPADAIGVGGLQMGHVIGDLDPQGLDLRHQVLVGDVQFLGQLVDAHAAGRRRRRPRVLNPVARIRFRS